MNSSPDAPKSAGLSLAGTKATLLIVAWISALIGAAATYRSRPWRFENVQTRPEWVARYDNLGEHIENEPLVTFLTDTREGKSRYRMYRAQYVLAPTVLKPKPGLSQLRVQLLLRRPLVLDYTQPQPLEEDIALLERRAREAGLDLEVVRLEDAIAVVRAGRRR